jgi:hypothetical protein
VSIQLTVHVGALTQRADAQTLANYLIQNLASEFRKASGGDINLRVVNRGVANGAVGGPVFSDTLHSSLEGMTGRQRGATQVFNIGLVIADSYQPAPSFFGVMFDDAFVPDGSSPWARTAREGCAVFLGGIDAGRATPAQRADEAVFTAIHELSHVFNLQHSTPPSFLAQSAATGPIPVQSARFTANESWLLSCCSKSRYIWPGGSGFGDLGDLAKSTLQPNPANASTVLLHIATTRSSFWAFEPIELDVVLTGRTAQPVSVRDALDPGYREFVVWVEQPGGERRTLRSPRHYCSPRGTLAVSSSTPFARDISIFGQSGGYTFHSVGVHKVWCTFEVEPGEAITSNVLELEVRAPQPSSSSWMKMRALFTNTHVAQLMYFRRLTPKRRRRLPIVAEWVGEHGRQPSAAMVHYALGRSLAQVALGGRSKAVRADAQMHLRLASRKESLGEHRILRAQELLAALG